MTEIVAGAGTDPYLEHLKQAKDSSSVLKYQLLALRGHLPKTLIFVFEGIEDKSVYYQWVRRISPELEYEPFPCKGKRKVLQLRDVVLQDRGSLADGVYFFVDRDFDDLNGHTAHESTFMTDTYSTENYLVTEGVLIEILRNELHCHAHPEIREPIIDLFRSCYKQFTDVTREINRRIFLARQLNINIPGMPDKINSLAVVGIDSVTAHASAPQDIIRLEREPTPEEISAHTPAFDALEPAGRYRGKFAIKFFDKWLNHLADDYANDNSVYFAGIDRTVKAKRAELVLGSMASKSHLPTALQGFIESVKPPA